MHKILCSTGAFIGKANGNDYRLIKEYASRIDCDGLELMMSSSWYSILKDVIATVKSYDLCIPVVHSTKSLGESLCGMRTTYENGGFNNYVMTEDEDREEFRIGTEKLKCNIELAKGVGAKSIVLHLWNGLVSDKCIDKNVERFGTWKDIADEAGIDLMVENVICNTYDPLHNVGLVAEKYSDANFVYDTKMAEFHCQTMDLFKPEYEYIAKEGRIHHLHINDYSGGFKDWGNMRVLPIGMGHVDFDAFFAQMSKYNYKGDFTIEATAINKEGIVDFDMLNNCVAKLKELRKQYFEKGV